MSSQGLQVRIRSHLLRLIDESPVGALLPSEKMIADEFQASRATVQMVMGALQREGFIERNKGRGSFVQHKEKRIFNDAGHSYRGSILYVYPDFMSLEFILFRKIIEEQALRAQLNVIEMRVSRYSTVEPIRKLLDETPCLRGVIAFPGPVQNGDYRSLFENRDFPAILIGEVNSAPNVYSINPDYGKLGRLCIEYLIKCGHRKITLIKSEPSHISERSLQSGMKQALRDLKLPQRTLEIYDCRTKPWENASKAAYTATGALLEGPDAPSVLIYEAFESAVAGLRAINEKGLKCPDDVSVILTASPEPPLDEYIYPQLTYLTCSRERVVSAAMEIIMGTGRGHSSNILIDIELSEKESIQKKGN